MTELSGKKVFITGGAQGIGKEIAHAFVDRGCELLLSDINKERLEQTGEQLRSRGANCLTYVLDVTDTKAIARVHKKIVKDVGAIDVLVNNAGIVFGGPFLETPLEDHLATYRVNIEGMVAVTYHFLPMLIGRGSAHLVNIASASGFIGLPNGSSYASSKWAAIGFSESIRLELKRQGHHHVNVTTVCPSYVATGMFDGVHPPRTTQMIDPAKLAGRVTRAVRKNREFVIEPWLVKITPFFRAALPVPVWDLVADMFGASGSMEGWHGHESGD